MTKHDFIKRLQRRLGNGYTLAQVEEMAVGLFEELKDVVREGDELHINALGRFYPKHMRPRKVSGGFRRDGREYAVSAKVKLGFSSFKNTDDYVSDQVVPRSNDGLFSDIER